MDKLAMEEAGFRNCISVPDGAPSCVSMKDLPPEERVRVDTCLLFFLCLSEFTCFFFSVFFDFEFSGSLICQSVH